MPGDGADEVVGAGAAEGDGGWAVAVVADGAAGGAGLVLALADLGHSVRPAGEVELCRRGGKGLSHGQANNMISS